MTITLYNSGQERFTAMTRVYYRRASACVIMFDVAQPNSFHNAAKWKKDLDSKCFNSSGKNIPCILVANKIDLPMKIDKDEINNLCKEHQFLGWTEMSVKDDKHVAETMEFLVAELMSPSATEVTGYVGPPELLLTEDSKRSCCGS
ncbi:ras-related Rab-7L1-like [Paramuricea clavata]|uniref:Ras-related Rab-7L1-like n=1 Tax=Paramuricea clavata TaxID=317549 RepID=A0A7D9DLI7_PARCT|nr:ras-related Rab-7L1-like [Paramuricea clavata]